jgi:hypothetical protein
MGFREIDVTPKAKGGHFSIKLVAWDMLILSRKTSKENNLSNVDFSLASLEYQQIFQRTNNGLN